MMVVRHWKRRAWRSWGSCRRGCESRRQVGSDPDQILLVPFEEPAGSPRAGLEQLAPGWSLLLDRAPNCGVAALAQWDRQLDRCRGRRR